jgi:hypothetical protein
MSGADLIIHTGGCHCGSVRFVVALPDQVEAHSCNCSMCSMVGFVHIIVPESRFEITEGTDNLKEYRFNTGVARHLFCAVCGVKPFYRPRSNPDGWSVNANCLDDLADLNLVIEPFDGQNWEANAKNLAHLSQEAP